MLYYEAHLFLCSLYYCSEVCGQCVHHCLQEALVSERILLKTIQKWRRNIVYLRLSYHHNTLEVRMHSARLVVSSNCNVRVVSWTSLGIINTTESLVEEIIETLMYLIGLTEKDSMTSSC